jgi:hypothetical protein
MRIDAQPDGEVDSRFVPGTDSPEILETMTSPISPRHDCAAVRKLLALQVELCCLGSSPRARKPRRRLLGF